MIACNNTAPMHIKSEPSVCVSLNTWLFLTDHFFISLCDSFISPYFKSTKLFSIDKGAYSTMERLRMARYFGVPMLEKLPKDYPPVTLGVRYVSSPDF